ncbi:MAG: hypothetical protein JNK29_12070 [Anaerolineales bacterium]|nr:hypothetical protein [Anaerolineales bacterium]
MSTNGPLSIFLASPNTQQLLKQAYPAFVSDPARFQVISFCEKWKDFADDVSQYRPEVVIVEAGLAPDPHELRDALARLPSSTTALVILPATGGWPERQGMLEAVTTSVRGVFIAPVNWARIAASAYSAGVTERTRLLEAAPAAAAHAVDETAGARPAAAVVGTRTIAALSFAGGPGKSTVMETLAVHFARNNVRTLLASLNSPPAAVGHLGVKFSPNATEWFNRPTTDGFKAALQKLKGLDTLDVLLAPEDPEALAEAAARPPEHPASIRSLILAAHSFNYGVVLLDLPPFADSMWAVQGVLAANMALLICRATVHDQFAAVRAYKLFTERLAAQHRVPLESIFAVINMKSPDDNLSERDFATGVANVVGSFPPILASFPYVAKLPAVQNRGQSPALAPETEVFARIAHSLASKLIGGTVMEANEANGRSAGKSLFGIKFKIK